MAETGLIVRSGEDTDKLRKESEIQKKVKVKIIG